jgi:hypothetical protein
MWKRVGKIGLLLLSLTVASTSSVQADPTATPVNLMVPAQNVLLFKTSATGTQIYVCKAKADDSSAFEWAFKAPDAELWNDLGEKVGTHYAGPVWEGNDGSKVTAEVVERANAPETGAIPWLLLKAKSHDGAGVFSSITYVQRLETVGGVAPTETCNQPAVGTERAVEYSATYAFFYGAMQ